MWKKGGKDLGLRGNGEGEAGREMRKVHREREKKGKYLS